MDLKRSGHRKRTANGLTELLHAFPKAHLVRYVPVTQHPCIKAERSITGTLRTALMENLLKATAEAE